MPSKNVEYVEGLNNAIVFLYLTYCRYYPGDRLNDETEKETNVYFVSEASELSRNNKVEISVSFRKGEKLACYHSTGK